MANIQCGGDPAVIYGDSEMDPLVYVHNNVGKIYKTPYMIAVTVNVTTTNDDGTVTYQILSITNATFYEYKKKKDFAKSPWTWSYEGSEVDESKKLVGHYQNTGEGLAVIVNGKMTIEFRYVRPSSWRFTRKPALRIECPGNYFRALESFPKTICGGLNNTEQEYRNGIAKHMPGDRHHLMTYYRNVYIVLANDVLQPKPVCQEASDLINSGRCGMPADFMNNCFTTVAGGPIQQSHNCRDFLNMNDLVKMAVACLRVSCNSEEASSEDTCQTLQQLYDACGDTGSMRVGELLKRANCPRTTAPTNGWNCTVSDKYFIETKGPYAGSVELFGGQKAVLNLPCRYKMAKLRCAGSDVEIETDHSFDDDGFVYIGGITVTIDTPDRDGRVIHQNYKLTLETLTEYINAGKFEKRVWAWSHNKLGRQQKEMQAAGFYNQTTKSADIAFNALNIKYFYIDPKDSNRSGNTLLQIQCSASDFRSYLHTPDSVCGSPADTQAVYERSLAAATPIDFHFKVQEDAVMLSTQNMPQRKPFCREMAETLTGNQCLYTMDKLYECRRITSGTCLRKDSFKVVVACLRVLCGNYPPTEDTCWILERAAKMCGGKGSPITLATLYSMANCPSVV